MMKLTTIIILFSLVLCVKSQNWLWDSARFMKEAAQGDLFQGAGDMARAYLDMREANYKNSDKYFHARGNYDAARRGPGGAWAAEKISDAREYFQGGSSGRGVEDSKADQAANKWGRDGNDPNHFRPKGLDPKY